MNPNTVKLKECPVIDIEGVAALIARTQRTSGEIPWSEGDKTDPWDHVESAMGLNIAGYYLEARQAFEWLANNQLRNGSWYSSYRGGAPEDRTQDTNISSYIAVGLYHQHLITGDLDFLGQMWPVMSAGIEFALNMQAPGGEIHWAVSPEGVVDPMALLTGSSSVYMSLKCALAVAQVLGQRKPDWEDGLHRLRDAIRNRRSHFNMTKSRFSMDWFYPILAGVVTDGEAQRRIEKYWDRFVVKGHGVRCVSDQPWVTIAETSELVMALAAMGNTGLARIVFSWIQDRRFEDGSYWAGYTYPDMVIWPEEKITWTNAGVLMVVDTLYGLTPAGRLFSHSYWNSPEFAAFMG
jgi:hypothetical protein